MRKIRYLLFLIILLLPFTMVNASGSVARDVVVKEVSGRATADAFDVDQNTFTPHITFYNIDDSASYAFTLDYDSQLYDIDAVATNNSNKDIKLYVGNRGNTFFMTFYYNSVSEDLYPLKPIDFDVRLKAKDTNPPTGVWAFWLVISLYAMLTIFLIFTFKKKKLKTLLLLLFLIPLIGSAKEYNIIHITIDPSDIKFGYIVHFNANGGTGTVSDILCVTGEECVVPSDVLESSSGIFLGWGNSSDSEYLYSETGFIYGCNATGLESTLYAVWYSYNREYDYTGDVQQYRVYVDGQYKLEVWGAQGGNQNTDGTASGGLGGYATGIISLSAGDVLNIYVGGEGQFVSNGLSAGGYNGGGSCWSSSSEPGAGGGGATDIRVNSDSLYARVIVAGGGGGAGEDGDDDGGSGGGSTGGTGNDSYGRGGTQTDPGNGGGFGFGAHNAGDGGGGGGGWYGGGVDYSSSEVPSYSWGDDTGGAGGGSGYIYNSASSSYYPSGCLLNSSYYLTDSVMYCYYGPYEYKRCVESSSEADKTIVTSNYSSSATSNYAKTGNGYARITYLEE